MEMWRESCSTLGGDVRWRQQCNSVICVAGSVDEKYSEDPHFSFIIRIEGSGKSNLLVVIMINILCLKTHISQVMHGPPVPADLPLC